MRTEAERSCVLRPMRPQDVDLVHRIECASYEFPWREGIFRDCLRAGHECRVVLEHSEVVGYGITMIAADEAHLLNLCLTESVRGAGFARTLLQELCDTASAKGAKEMYLEVRSSNPAAIALYHQFGFNEIGRRRDYYNAAMGREDALILATAL